jgi:hypothetical protein
MRTRSKWVSLCPWFDEYWHIFISELTESECKLKFLQFLNQQETFGSTFFVVNQKTINSYPETLLIAINRNGFHIIDSVKKVICSLGFSFIGFSKFLFCRCC